MKRPFTVSVALGLTMLVAFIWVAFGVLVVAHTHPALPDSLVIRLGMALLSFVLAGLLLSLWIYLRRRSRAAYWFSIVLMSGMVPATILDDVGWADLVFLGLCVLEVGLLLKERCWFLGRPA